MRTQMRAPARVTLVALLSVAATGLVATAAQASATDIKINEVESSGGSPGDWVELTNTGASTVDVSGWIIKDNDNAHSYTIAASTTIAPGAFRAFDVETSYGLGAADSARVFQPDGTTLIDSYTWTSHASTTYGRCVDGTGSFVTTNGATKGAANSCPGTTWPGGSSVSTADNTNAFGTNLSGLTYESSTVAWAVKNGASTLYRLVPSGSLWVADSGAWASGKGLRYASGSGDPDAEGVVATADGMMVATERDNNNSGTSLLKVLRYDTAASGSTLNATAEWNLTSDLPSVAANSGLEAISWVPDSALTAAGFVDENTGTAYSSSTYSNHGGGLYFVGLEANGVIYAYALNQSGTTYTRVATITSGFAGVMDLEYESSTGKLWAACDDTCSGQTKTFSVNGSGHFAATATYLRPSGMSNYNNEGFALSPTCSGGVKQVLWADDSNDSSHALRSGTLTC